MNLRAPNIPWLQPGSAFPPASSALGDASAWPGLLAAGGDLTVATLTRAYGAAVFPWFSDGQPILWWSTDPRMVLQVDAFRLHRSLRKTLLTLIQTSACEIRIDSAFAQVITHCAQRPGAANGGTWIVADMVTAYTALHQAGLAHSVETWVKGELVGGLYCVALGKAVFGESMFSRATDASKIALAALVALCRQQGITMIDCQQNTAHLASLGATPIPREQFVKHVALAQLQEPTSWHFNALYWNQLFPPRSDSP